MDIILVLIPIALATGFIGVVAFMWALRSGQFDDPKGNAERILLDDLPAPPPEENKQS